MSSGETDLDKILTTLKPILRPGIYVYTSLRLESSRFYNSIDYRTKVKLPQRHLMGMGRVKTRPEAFLANPTRTIILRTRATRGIILSNPIVI